ncbi:MAG: hypothetical protein M1835_002714 [Candelina submexicana]|nr:MAG: hypothetical protein M1835_002714 [Candelina submexicana]
MDRSTSLEDLFSSLNLNTDEPIQQEDHLSISAHQENNTTVGLPSIEQLLHNGGYPQTIRAALKLESALYTLPASIELYLFFDDSCGLLEDPRAADTDSEEDGLRNISSGPYHPAWLWTSTIEPYWHEISLQLTEIQEALTSVEKQTDCSLCELKETARIVLCEGHKLSQCFYDPGLLPSPLEATRAKREEMEAANEPFLMPVQHNPIGKSTNEDVVQGLNGIIGVCLRLFYFGRMASDQKVGAMHVVKDFDTLAVAL